MLYKWNFQFKKCIINYNELKKILNYMYSHSKIACGINLLSTNVDYQNPKDFHYNPSKVIDIVQKISKNFKIRQIILFMSLQYI